MLAHTPIFDAAIDTKLGRVLAQHTLRYRMDPAFSLGFTEVAWANALFTRAQQGKDARLSELVQSMLELLSDPPTSADQFKRLFQERWEEAHERAYPLSSLLRQEWHNHSGITLDYTLQCIDLGMVRTFEDQAVVDPVMQGFVVDMCGRLRTKGKRPWYQVLRQVFDVYSEALVYHLLTVRGGGRITVEKISETNEPTPDFSVQLQTCEQDQPQTLAFFVEVKALDIVQAEQRLPQMIDQGIDTQIALEEHVRAGQRVAIETGIVAPFRRYQKEDKDDPKFTQEISFDPYSIREVIETLIQKAATNFKRTQFGQGPTFALLNLLRLAGNQGVEALAPFHYDDHNGGACVSGILWHVAFGRKGSPVHRSPEFEGSGTVDGNLQRDGLLVDPALALPTPGLIVLSFRDGAYRLDALYDPTWTTNGWSNVQTETVLDVICDERNDQNNSEAWKYSLAGANPRCST